MIFSLLIRAMVFLFLIIMPTTGFAKLTFVAENTDEGDRYIIVVGDFEFGDHLGEFSRIVVGHKALGVTFDSRGGNISKALELGSLIRKLGLATFQPRGFDCISACAFAFMGGVERYAEPGAIGVHKSSFRGDIDIEIDVDMAVSAVQELTADIIQYMVEMGVNPALLQLALKYESDDVRFISKREMRLR
jgi:hypothetical protein